MLGQGARDGERYKAFQYHVRHQTFRYALLNSQGPGSVSVSFGSVSVSLVSNTTLSVLSPLGVYWRNCGEVGRLIKSIYHRPLCTAVPDEG